MFKFLTLSSQFRFSANYRARLQKLHNQRRFSEMLGLKEGMPLSPPNISKNELRKAYLDLIKKYHSDKCQDNPERAKEYEEISKLIISAYYNIEKQVFPEDQYKKEYETEDQICRSLFGISYNQAKYKMYEPGNENMKEKFLQQLAKRTGQTYTRPEATRNEQSSSKKTGGPIHNNSNPSNQEQNSSFSAIGIGAVAILALGIYFATKSSPKESKPVKKQQIPTEQDYGKKIDEIKQHRYAKTQQKSQAMIKSLLKDQPPCLKYPDEEPHLFTQLTEYSIGPDVHLYEVPAKYYDQQVVNEITKNPDAFNPQDAYRIKRIKPNTALTLSLEAERTLQNVYVRVKDLIKQIQEKGKYEPPKIFTKFHGYTMIEIREKPITLRNYKDTEYISLFDLYFDYYSPIFLKKDQFCQYLVGKDQPQIFGWVYLNHRKCHPVYLKRNQKYAFFMATRFEQWENINRKIWDGFYKRYQDRWRPGGNTKQRIGI